MKKFFCCLICLFTMFVAVSCGSGESAQAIELMGAGDRIHDSYTFANTGVKIKDDGDNSYTIYGSVDKLEDDKVKEEFNIDEDVDYVVAIKLTAIDTEVEKDEVEISVDGSRNYDAEHLNGSDYTFIILEAIPGNTAVIKVKWNSESTEKVYSIYFDSQLTLN